MREVFCTTPGRSSSAQPIALPSDPAFTVVVDTAGI
jgi:hypothetical protein